jgi:hypothetical protein
MTNLEREFYRSGRGPTPNDEDVWRLVLTQARCIYSSTMNGKPQATPE